MTYFYCRCCNHRVNDKATVCPYCAKEPKTGKAKGGSLFWLGVVVLAAWIFIYLTLLAPSLH